MDAPAALKPEHLRFLDALRESGACNMFGAAAPLAEMFGLDPDDARTVLVYWMRTFAERHPKPSTAD